MHVMRPGPPPAVVKHSNCGVRRGRQVIDCLTLPEATSIGASSAPVPARMRALKSARARHSSRCRSPPPTRANSPGTRPCSQPAI